MLVDIANIYPFSTLVVRVSEELHGRSLPSKHWRTVPHRVEGRNFVVIDDHQSCTDFFGPSITTLVADLKQRRNQKVAELKAESARDDDRSQPKRCKRDIMDQVPRIITINMVARKGNEATIDVL